ncbi:hypothetical protein AOC05_00170 [Arthrobacter alpinus]|uniref:Uncharacterized protein n=1 Tax=Arthrobacter alpinus TaxID=656366 RepID=A0A0M4QKI4_9MICC|nr:hypothetical protein AOC05_00170 [Arthrobacter alpinus]
MIGFRTLASTSAHDAERKIAGILENWFKSKGFEDLPEREQKSDSAKGHTLQHQYRELDNGTKAFRWVYTEQWDKAPWQEDGLNQTAKTHITLATSGETVWFLADIHPPLEKGRYGERPRDTATPTFVRTLLDAVEFYDGQTLLPTGHSLAESAESLDVVLNSIQDDDRRGMVLVSTPPIRQTPTLWQETIRDVLRGTQGLTSVHMIAPEKLDAFNEWAGTAHGLMPGAIRTYKTGVNFENPLDGYVHRIMQHHRIVGEHSKKLNSILRRSLVAELASAELPDVLRQADVAFRKVVRQHLSSAGLENSSVSSELQDENKELTELLEMSDQENSELRNRAEDAEKYLKNLIEDNEVLNLELSSQQDQSDRIHADNRVLKRKLWDRGDESAYLPVVPHLESVKPPETFTELLERIGEIPGVLYCGDAETTVELDEFTDLGVSVVQKTWEVLRTFDAYAQARADTAFEGGIFQYQRNPEHGHYMRIRQISAHESDTVQKNQRMREQRTFAVPTEIDPTGQMIMYAHIPLATGRGRSPRLHFEDTWPTNGRVTIGYIGAHLDNKSTN